VHRRDLKTSIRVGRRSFICGLLLTSAVGCRNLLQRGQSPDSLTLPVPETRKRPKKEGGLIGEISAVYGINYAKVEGIGLAFGLRETGSNPKPGAQRDYLVRELQSLKLEANIETVLAGKDTEMVFLKGMIPPGAKKGEKFDIEIGTMRATEGTSLEHGMVSRTNLKPMEQLGRSIQKGSVVAIGTGRILIDSLFESRKDKSNHLHGYILGGGTLLEDREFGLKLEDNSATMRNAVGIVKAINARFTYVDRTGRHGVADPKSDDFVKLVTPHEYRHNFGRFLQVVFNMAFLESPSQRLERLEQLEQEILDPNQAEITSLKFEAIGADSIPILKRVLRHHDLEVRFHAAQALAYMGENDGVAEIRQVAEKEPAFRWHAFRALSSLAQPEAASALKELLHTKSAETRYGAFQALLAHSPNDPLVHGKQLGDFKFYRIPSDTDFPMLHFSRTKQAEIVLFGENQTVSADFMHVEPNLTVRGTPNQTVTITRHTLEGDQRMVVSNQVGDLIEGLYQAGIFYSDQLKILQQAKNNGTLNSRLAVNAVPRLGRTYIPGQYSEEPTLDESSPYFNEPIIQPSLAHGSSRRSKDGRTADKKPNNQVGQENNGTDSADATSTNTLERWKNWWTGG